jgi:hypothetical protein
MAIKTVDRSRLFSVKTWSVSSARKVMALVFWDAEGILFTDYLEKCKTITEEYYSNF